MSLSDLRKKSASNFEKLTKQLNSLSSNNSKDPTEDLFWKPDVDKAGNGYAVIRFIPPQNEDIPFVRIYDHGFQGPTGKWYIEKSLTTIGKNDPVGELNSKLWNAGDQDTARKQKRRLSYFSNIYVIKDPSNPANEGKVFLFKYGKKIFDKINDLINPQFEDEKPINPFDLWEGANFRLKIRMVEGYRNYDKSEFEASAALSDDEDELERIYKQTHSLQQFLDPKNFKTYEELEAKLNMVLGLSAASSSTPSRTSRNVVEEDDLPVMAPTPKKEAKPEVEPAPWKTDDEDDDDFAFLKRLAEED